MSEKLSALEAAIMSDDLKSNPTTNQVGVHESTFHPSPTAQEAQAEAARNDTRGYKRFLVLFAMYSTAFLYGLDTTITSDVQAAVISDLGEIEKLGWIGTGFPLGSVATILVVGISYGIFNVKYLYLLSIFLFEVGSAVCGSAQNMNSLIIGRVIAGVGGGGMYLGLLNYVAILTTEQERATFNGLIGLLWGTGAILGPVIGGAFSDSGATWRWSFYINLVVAGISAPVFFVWFPNYDPQPGKPIIQKLRSIDWLGAILHAAVFSLFIVTLTFAGATWAWNDGRIIALWVVFGTTLVFHILQQRFLILTTKETRLFPVQFIQHRSLPLIFFTTAASSSTLLVTTYYLPLYFQFVHGDDAIHAAVRLLPFILFTISFIMLSGYVLSITGHYMPWYPLSGALLISGASLMYVVTPDTPIASVYGFSILLGAGTGASFQLGYTVAATQVKPEEISAAISFINVAQLGSSAIALAISGSMFQNIGLKKLRAALAGSSFSTAQLQASLAGTRSTLFSSANPAQKVAAIKAIVDTLDQIYSLSIAAGALILLCAVFMRRERLNLKN